MRPINWEPIKRRESLDESQLLLPFARHSCDRAPFVFGTTVRARGGWVGCCDARLILRYTVDAIDEKIIEVRVRVRVRVRTR